MHGRAGCTRGAEEDTLEVVASTVGFTEDVVASKEYHHSIIYTQPYIPLTPPTLW